MPTGTASKSPLPVAQPAARAAGFLYFNFLELAMRVTVGSGMQKLVLQLLSPKLDHLPKTRPGLIVDAEGDNATGQAISRSATS